MLSFAFLTDPHVTHRKGVDLPGPLDDPAVDPGDDGESAGFLQLAIERALTPWPAGLPPQPPQAPQILVFGGDMLHQCADSPGLAPRKWARFERALLDALAGRAVPFIFTFGNHELTGYATDIYGGKAFFRAVMLKASVDSLRAANYTVQYRYHLGLSDTEVDTTFVVTTPDGGQRFIVLDNVSPAPSANEAPAISDKARRKGTYRGALSLEQMHWLRHQLDDLTPTVVLSHIPLLPNGFRPDDRMDGDEHFFDQTHGRVARANTTVMWPELGSGVNHLLNSSAHVLGVLSGHTHLYRHRRLPAGSPLWLCGGHLRACITDIVPAVLAADEQDALAFEGAELAFTLCEMFNNRLDAYKMSYVAPSAGEPCFNGTWDGPMAL